ncbi:hypothetical protein KUL25_14920 [Rhodobacteraceae bacterium N5(2021)]|uniref:Uncharacterized protein n=1 Tax=Gymnodinialimonas phycosphaerae TaxID=2841589 RepID=A0A975YEW6_9RHOB|nr:hypothetical protein [Gymnodinialimonas phycosphaerae]MBY4894049.1 hypothetical protein [Gymnodinialimonas phycosphaerae]
MSRAEKLSILSAMLGPDAIARLRDGQNEAPAEFSNAPVEVDAERAAWQRNRLLERLRQQGRATPPKPAQAASAPEKEGVPPREGARGQRQWGPENAHLDARLASISDFSTLGQEHPAIIARLVKALPREERVEALKSLPGPMARSIVRRLR